MGLVEYIRDCFTTLMLNAAALMVQRGFVIIAAVL